MRRKFKIPNTLVLLFFIIVIAWASTYILPSGSFELAQDQHNTIIPDTYQVKEKSFLSVYDIFLSIPRAFEKSQSIIFFILIIGGALAVIRSTGMIDAFLGKMLEKFGKKPQILIFMPMFVFAAGSSTLGMGEEYLPFVPILIALCTALGFNTLTALGILIVGYGVGFGAATINPFTVIIAQEIAGLQPLSGLWYRILIFIPLLLVGWHHVHKYAFKKGRIHTKNLTTDVPFKSMSFPQVTKLHVFVAIALITALGVIIWGIYAKKWYLEELSAVFLALTILVGIMAKMKPNKVAVEFANGATELTITALLIGFAKAIAIILEDGEVLHTIIYALGTPLKEAGGELSAAGMYILQCVVNFFIPSGSGQAYITMPLMSPIADITGVSRQVAVLAFQFGDGFANMIIPTSPILMGMLGIAKVPFDQWFRFILPLMLKLLILGVALLAIAIWIGY